MKNRMHIFCLLLMSLICQPCIADGYLIGDMNGDGVISIADIVSMIEIMNGNGSSKINAVAGDVNHDAKLSVSDIISLSNILINKDQPASDTLHLYFSGADVLYSNPYSKEQVSVSVPAGSADVFISNNGCSDLVISAQGKSSDARIYVNSNSEYTLHLNGVSLTSSHAPSFNSVSSEKMKVEIADKTTNSFSDAKKYTLAEGETASGCFNSMGQMTITGNGTLNVQGKSKHAIYSLV